MQQKCTEHLLRNRHCDRSWTGRDGKDGFCPLEAQSGVNSHISDKLQYLGVKLV